MGRMGRNGRRARRPQYGYGSLTHRLRLAVLAVPIMVLSQIAIFPAGNVSAVDNTGQFEMDGNIVHNSATTPPYDWASLFDSSGNQITPKPSNMLDSAFVKDYATPDNTYFQSNKDIQQIGTGAVGEWACAPIANPLAKDDIQNTYAAVFKIPASAPENAGDTVLNLGIERLSNNGDSFAGFWLFKDPTVGCSGTNNFSGHHQTGDTLILTNFTNGGGTANVSVFQWTGGPTGSLSTTPLASGNVCGVAPGGTTGDSVCAISNTATNNPPAGTITSPWFPTSHDADTFTEAAIDLTQVFSAGSTAGPCFSNFMGETRSSQEITATLKDFAGGLLNTCTKPPVTTLASGHGSTQFPGSAQHDTATVAGTPTPTGTATFFLCSPTQTTSAGCPSGAGTQVGSPVTLTSGSAQSTPDVTGTTTPNDLAVGSYCWGAQYTPDPASQDLYLASYGTDNTNECFTVAKAAPTMATQANFASGSGDLSSNPVLSDTATLTNVHTGTGGAPAGETVNFSLFGPFAGGVTPSCGGTPLFTSTGTLSGSGTTYTATSGTHAVTATGTYVWTASYAGDAFNNSATEGCNGTNESQAISTPLLSITKVADKTTVSAGDGIGFTITVTNSSAAGTGNATGVALSDPLPAGTGINWSIASQTGTACPALATPPTQTLSCSIGTLTPGQSYTVHVTSGTTASSCATYPNTATASATNQTAGNVTASASTTVDCPNVSVLKTPDHDTVNAGSAIGFTVTVSNSGAAGTGTARGVTLTDDLPAGSGVNWSISPAYTGPGTCTITGPVGSQVLGCSFGDMAPGASASVHITSATAFASCATYQNTASVGVTNENGSPFTSTASTTVQCPGLHITKTADATPVSTGTSIGFTVTVSNAGPGTATAVTLNDPLPAGSGVDWMISPAYTGPGSCSITGPVGTQVLGCSFGDMANGASIPIHISSVTTAASAGTYPNTATASSTNAPSVNASATIVVLAPNMMVAKTTDHATVSAGSAIGFTVTITNPGNSTNTGTATSVSLTDPLPAGTGVSWSIDTQSGSACSITGTVPTQSLSCSFTSFAPGASYSVHITSGTAFASCATYPNTATVGASNQTGTVHSSVSTTVQCPGLGITKTADATPVSTGTSIGFVVTVSNSGPGTATAVTVNDPLPAGSGVNWSIASQTASACSITGPVGTQVLGCTLGDMAASASYTVHITSPTTSASAGTYPNTATASSTNAPSVNASATIVVLAPALSITKTADATPVSTGTSIGFTVTVSNSDATNTGTATSVTLNDPLPAGSGIDWTISPAYTGPGTCSIAGAVGSQTLSCSFGDMAPGASASVHISSVTTAASAGTYPNTATASAGNAPSVNASATIVVLAPNVTVAKTADNATVSAGSAIGFTVTISNPGNSTNTGTATSVSLTDPLPAGTGVVWSIDSQDGTACSITGTAPSQSLSCSFTSFAPGASYDVHVTSRTAFASCADYTNTATVGASNQTGTLSATASTTVQCPTLAITKTADATPVSEGTPIGFVVKVTNGGPGTATGVMVNDPLPAGTGVVWSIASQTASACSITGTAPTQTLVCSIGDMTAESSYTVHITSPTTAGSAGTYPNTATVSATNAPSGSATATITVQAPALAITKTADSASVTSGDTVGFTVTVSNSDSSGTGTATAVTLNDPLPSGSGVDWSISPAYTGPGTCTITGTAGSQTLTCSFGDMAPGATASVHVTSATTSNVTCSPLSNTATASAGNAASLQASATITVACGGVLSIVTPSTGWGSVLWAAIPLVGSGFMLLLFAAMGRRRRRMPDA